MDAEEEGADWCTAHMLLAEHWLSQQPYAVPFTSANLMRGIAYDIEGWVGAPPGGVTWEARNAVVLDCWRSEGRIRAIPAGWMKVPPPL